MPLANCRITPPRYDSDRDIPPFSEYNDQFVSFTLYQRGGAALIKLIYKVLGKESRFFNHADGHARAAPDNLDDAIVLNEAQLLQLEVEAIGLAEPMEGVDPGSEGDSEGEAAVAVRNITTYSDLFEIEKQLDRDLYSILAQSISGKHRFTIGRCQFPSFVQAWVLLHKELGASNIKRKTDLLASMQLLTYKGDVGKFKREAGVLVNAIYDNHVTLEDILIYSIMSALPREVAALKIISAEKVNEGNKVRVVC